MTKFQEQLAIKKQQKSKMPLYITHQDTNSFTNEGFGSHARGSIYPLLNIALAIGLRPVLNNETFWSNSGRNYKGINFSEFLGINENIPEGCSKITIDTWKSAFGYTDGLIDEILIQKNCEESSELIVLSGPLRYTNPSAKVIGWFNSQFSKWHEKKMVSMSIHIRRGDMEISKNQSDWFIEAIKTVNKVIPQIPMTIVTEENFSAGEEAKFREEFSWIEVKRGGTTTILEDIKTLATSKILIGSKSFFSALAGYLAPEEGIIIIDEDNSYFNCHNEIRNNVYKIKDSRLINKLSLL